MKDNKIASFEDTCVTNDDVRRLREKLQKDLIDVISLRNCTVMDKDFKQLLKAVGTNRTLRHVCLNIDQVTDKSRVQLVAQAVQKNVSLAGLQ